jgi:hypothetical protein
MNATLARSAIVRARTAGLSHLCCFYSIPGLKREPETTGISTISTYNGLTRVTAIKYDFEKIIWPTLSVIIDSIRHIQMVNYDFYVSNGMLYQQYYVIFWLYSSSV